MGRNKKSREEKRKKGKGKKMVRDGDWSSGRAPWRRGVVTGPLDNGWETRVEWDKIYKLVFFAEVQASTPP